MDVCAGAAARKRDMGALNLFYHQDFPVEHLTGMVISPLSAVLVTDELSQPALLRLNDAQR